MEQLTGVLILLILSLILNFTLSIKHKKLKGDLKKCENAFKELLKTYKNEN